jgi:hypothetical protein
MRSSRKFLEMESTIMKRTWWVALVAIGIVQWGCGGKSDTSPGPSANPIAESAGAPPAPTALGAQSIMQAPPTQASSPNPLDAMVPLSSLNLANPTKPEEVVGAFLDGMRTGNAATIEGLLSTRARKEITDKGLDIAPIGSPQARFEIGVAQTADPKDPNTMLVSSNWLEPGANGQPPSEYEVVWALIREQAGWRICEMAVDTHQAGEDIQVVNFENLADVVPPETAPAANAPAGNAPRTAANPNASTPGLPPAGLPATNLPAVNPPPSNGLPALPGPPASGAGRLPPLPAANLGNGKSGQAGTR